MQHFAGEDNLEFDSQCPVSCVEVSSLAQEAKVCSRTQAPPLYRLTICDFSILTLTQMTTHQDYCTGCVGAYSAFQVRGDRAHHPVCENGLRMGMGCGASDRVDQLVGDEKWETIQRKLGDNYP